MPRDYFSAQSDAYRRFRPTYPAALFDFLSRDLPQGAAVWDCATGNGQAAAALSRHAAIVVATDQSGAQLARAATARGVYYAKALAEAAPLARGSMDLVTVAQALHWFDFERFYAEVRRVLKPGGLLAAWTYSFLSVSPQLGAEADAAIRAFYHDVIGAYWPPERRWVDEHYRTIPFPFTPLPAPEFSIDISWDLDALLGYVSSWSAVQRYKDARGRDPVPALRARLATVFGDPASRRRLAWPLDLRLGRHTGE